MIGELRCCGRDSGGFHSWIGTGGRSMEISPFADLPLFGVLGWWVIGTSSNSTSESESGSS